MPRYSGSGRGRGFCTINTTTSTETSGVNIITGSKMPVKGLRSPDQMQLDLLATYNASTSQTLRKLRLPASTPYLFASLKVGIAASLVGAIVGELSATVGMGIGGRLLSGSYYGQTLQIWAALFAAAIVAASLVSGIGLIERISLRRMGMAR